MAASVPTSSTLKPLTPTSGASGDFDRALQAIHTGMLGKARKLFERAAAQGDPRAALKLGFFSLHGLGGAEPDVRHARQHFQDAASAKWPEAHYWLAMLETGAGFLSTTETRSASEFDTFAEHWQQAIAGDFLPALRALGVVFGARSALERAAQLGDRISTELLATSELWTTNTPDAHGAYDLNTALRQTYPVPNETMQRSNAFLQVFEHVLTPLQARYLRVFCAPSMQPARVRDPRTGQSIRSALRTNSATTVTPDRVDLSIRLLERRIAQVAGLELRRAEPLGVLRYQVGEEYRPHRDYLHDPTELAAHTPGQRLRTAFCYLNDVALGGETEFIHWSKRVSPSCGRVVVFDNCLESGAVNPDSVHAGLPVLAGEKWLATLWFRERNARVW